MGEKNKLYKTVPVRFSMINGQHIKTLQSLERLCREVGESRSQFMINAIEMYCERLNGRDGPESFPDNVKEDIHRYADGIKEKIKNEIRQELMSELLGVVSGIHPQIRAGTDSPVGTETGAGHPGMGDEVSELEQDTGIVENAMKWG